MSYRTGKVNLSVSKRLLLRADSLAAAPGLVALICFVRYSAALMPFYTAALIAAGGTLFTLFFAPVICCAAERKRSVSLGRYHAALAASCILAAVSVALLFNISPQWSCAARLTAASLSLTGYLLFSYVFAYAAFSVKNALVTTGAGFSPAGGAALALSCFSAPALMAILGVVTSDEAGYAGYICAIIFIVSGLIVYFASASSLPLLIGRGGGSKLSLKEVFAPFISGKAKVFSGTAFFAAAAAAFLRLGLGGLELGAYGLSARLIPAVSASLIAGALIFAVITLRALRFKERTPPGLSAAALVLTAAAASVPVIAAFIQIPGPAALSLAFVSAVAAGAGFGIALASAVRTFGTELKDSAGFMRALFALYAAGGAALAFSGAAYSFSHISFSGAVIFAYGLAAALSALYAVLSFLGIRQSPPEPL